MYCVFKITEVYMCHSALNIIFSLIFCHGVMRWTKLHACWTAFQHLLRS